MFNWLVTPVLIGLGLQLFYLSVFDGDWKEFEKNLKKEHIVIRCPKAVLWLGLFCSSVPGTFLVWSIFFPNGTESLWAEIVFALFLLLGLSFVWVALAWKIELSKHEDYFLLRTVFLKTYKIQYSDCISYQDEGGEDFILKTNTKTFKFPSLSMNTTFLREQLNLHQVRRIRP